YKADRDTVFKLLNAALATEIVCNLRYRRHYFMAMGIHAQPVAARRRTAARRRGAARRHAERTAPRRPSSERRRLLAGC
ncbi:MAG: hypothetical protein ACHQO8_14345, partial [Vicinamibacterales bacterium]